MVEISNAKSSPKTLGCWLAYRQTIHKTQKWWLTPTTNKKGKGAYTEKTHNPPLNPDT